MLSLGCRGSVFSLMATAALACVVRSKVRLRIPACDVLLASGWISDGVSMSRRGAPYDLVLC